MIITTALLAVMLAPAPPAAASSARCAETYTQVEHASYARKVWKRPSPSRRARKRVEMMRRCQHSERARVAAKRLTRRLRERRRERARMRSLLPYSCGSHGRFAIPCYIVACESKFDPYAQNASGAYGYYQLLPTWVPNGASISAQHAAAAKLWNGGAGAGNWVCA